MLDIFLKILLFAEIFLLSYSTLWLTDLYISNQTYIRDIFLILAGCFGIFLNLSIILEKTYVIPIVLLMSACLNSLFLLTNVSSSKDKWFSNILKAVSVIALINAISVKTWPAYFIALIIFMASDTIFILRTEDSLKYKLISYLFFFLIFIILFQSFFIKCNILAFQIEIIIYSALSIFNGFSRIKLIKESYN